MTRLFLNISGYDDNILLFYTDKFIKLVPENGFVAVLLRPNFTLPNDDKHTLSS